MPERSTENLLADLSRELAPVRRVRSLRATAVGLAIAFAIAIVVSGMLGLPLPGRAAGVAWGSATFLVVLLGLAAVGGGGLVAGLAGAVPGRGVLEERGRAVALTGLGVCALASVVWGLGPAALETDIPLSATLMCLARAAGLALLPAIAASLYIARAYDDRPRMGGVWTWLGAVSLGAALVHASCGAGGAPHVVLGHIVEPVAIAVLLGALLAPWLRRSPAEGVA